jgi:MEMO1 family protein
VGSALADIARDGRGAIVVSSDFTHYEPDETARRVDHHALERILALDAEGFYESLLRERLTICGGAAIAALAACARILSWRGRLIAYATSADAGADPRAVVGYAAVAFEEETHG